MQLLAVLLTLVALAVIVTFIGRLDRSIRFTLALAGDVGAVTLAQAAVLSQNDLQAGVLEVFVQESPVLDRLPLMQIEGNAYAYNQESTLPGVAFRSVNEAYVESTGVVVQASESLVILGGDADVDRFIVQTRGNLNDQRAVQTAMKTKAAAYKYQDTFFNGDVAVDPKSFDGLKKRIVGGQVLDAAVNGMGPVTGGHDFFDALDALISAVNGNVDALYMSKTARAKIMSSGRRLGGVEWVTALFADGAVQKQIPTYNGIPMLNPGTTAAGADILPQTETQGAAVNASSIYAVKFGESEGDQGVTGIFNSDQTDQPFMVDDLGFLQAQPVYRTRIEGYLGLAVFGGKAAARLRGVLPT